MALTGSFASLEQKPIEFSVGVEDTVSIALSGTFAHRIVIEVLDGVWQISAIFAGVTRYPYQVTKPGIYRLRCAEITSGVCNFSISSNLVSVLQSLASKSTLARGIRVHLFTDSLNALAYTVSTASSVVVSGGVVTVNTGGSHFCVTGNTCFFYNPHTTDHTVNNHPLSGINVKPTSHTNNTFTFPASFAGVTVADGDITTLNGGGWGVGSLISQNDQSLFHQLNSMLLNPFTEVALTGWTGASPEQVADLMAKAFSSSSPAFDIAWVTLGSNLATTPPTPTLDQVDQSIYENFYQIKKRIVLPALARGYPVVLQIPPPNGSGYAGGASNRNIGFARLRDMLLELAGRYRGQIFPLDVFACTVDASGDMGSGYNNGSDFVHITAAGHLMVARQLLPQLAPLFQQERGLVCARETTGVITAYATATAYVVGDIRSNNGHVYRQMNATGNSGASAGPSGTTDAQAIGGCLWDYVGPVGSGLLLNGGMTGTAGTDSSGLYGGSTIPDNFRIDAATNMPGTCVSNQTRPQTAQLTTIDSQLSSLVTKYNAALAKLDADAGVTDTNYAALQAAAAVSQTGVSNSVNWGKVWTLNLAPAAANQVFEAQQPVNLGPLMKPNTRYRATVDFIAGGDWTCIRNVYFQMSFPRSATCQATAQGFGTTTCPAKAGETIQRAIEFYTGDGQPTSGTFLIYVISSAAGTSQVHVGNLRIDPVDETGY